MILTTLSNISMNSDQPTWDFTSRELQIISYIQSGNSTKEIAESLNLSAFTIKKHRENIARKIGCSGKSDFRKAVFQFNNNINSRFTH